MFRCPYTTSGFSPDNESKEQLVWSTMNCLKAMVKKFITLQDSWRAKFCSFDKNIASTVKSKCVQSKRFVHLEHPMLISMTGNIFCNEFAPFSSNNSSLKLDPEFWSMIGDREHFGMALVDWNCSIQYWYCFLRI